MSVIMEMIIIIIIMITDRKGDRYHFVSSRLKAIVGVCTQMQAQTNNKQRVRANTIHITVDDTIKERCLIVANQ